MNYTVCPCSTNSGSLSEVRCVSRDDSKQSENEKQWWNQTATTSFGRIDRYYPEQMAKTDAHQGCGFLLSRDVLQDKLTELNPDWYAWAQRLKREPQLSFRRNPDGDVQLEGVSYDTFKYPACPNCGGILKPDVVFFGENIRASVRQMSERLVEQADALLLIGTTVATHSAYRLVRDAALSKKPIILINRGPTRADSIIDTRIGIDSSAVLKQLEQDIFDI